MVAQAPEVPICSAVVFVSIVTAMAQMLAVTKDQLMLKVELEPDAEVHAEILLVTFSWPSSFRWRRLLRCRYCATRTRTVTSQ